MERANWTDMTMIMMNEGPMGFSQQVGRSIYEKHEAVGCAKATGENSGDLISMCFGTETLLLNRETYDNSGNRVNNEFCKSRRGTYTVAEPMHFRAYKLCDDAACSGAPSHVSCTCHPSPLPATDLLLLGCIARRVRRDARLSRVGPH